MQNILGARKHTGLVSIAAKVCAGLAVVLSLTGVPEPAAAQGAFEKRVHVASGERVSSRLLSVGVGRSVIIDTAEAVADVLVSNPGVADAVVRTPNRIFVLGNKAGQANLVLFSRTGRELASFNLRVEPDTSDLVRFIQKYVPGSNIEAQSLNGNIILSGTAANAADAQRAADLAARYAGEGKKATDILNMITVDGEDQVHLKVTVAEVDREVIKQLGVQLNGAITVGNFGFGFANDTSFNAGTSVAQQTTRLASQFVSGGTTIGAEVKALQREGIVKTLAEPTLTAISGENASFLAGGEFPIPISQDDNEVTVEFKKFGVGLDFTPIVLSGGRISLKITTEVSELSSDGAVNIGTLTIPALKVRRAESTLELPSGGTLVMAGLLQESYRQSVNGVPGLMNLPVLGSLFKSRDFLRSQTELVVFVTPYIVNPIAASKVQRPDKNLAPANDSETLFLNRLNKVYRANGQNAQAPYHGQVGFIYK